MSLERVLYRSQSALPELTLPVVADILGASRSNNDRDDVTGMLAIGDDRFLQVLEGPRETLDRVLARISRDGRHTQIEILERRPVEARIFGEWRMAGVRVTPDLADRLTPLLADGADPGEAVAGLYAMAHDPLLTPL